MMKLKTHPKFLEDYNNYQKKILSVENEEVRSELSNLLNQFAQEVSAIDMHHDTLLINGRMPSGISESRSNLALIKKKLDARLSHIKTN